jgi:hypothetical protein
MCTRDRRQRDHAAQLEHRMARQFGPCEVLTTSSSIKPCQLGHGRRWVCVASSASGAAREWGGKLVAMLEQAGAGAEVDHWRGW